MKNNVLHAQSKLKTTNLSITEDFSAATRHARKKLVEYGKTLNTTFRLRYNKLYVDNKCFMYDSATDSVFECGRSPPLGGKVNVSGMSGGVCNATSSSYLAHTELVDRPAN